MKEYETYYTVAEIAERLRVSKMTVYRLCQEGKLDYIRVRHSYRIPETSFNEYLKTAEEFLENEPGNE